MSYGQFADISVFQSEEINWNLYKSWSSTIDGVSRIAMRSSYGRGYTDANFFNNRRNAINAGIDQIIMYHYAYPQYNTGEEEALWFSQVVGPNLRPNDFLALDIEENVINATSEWTLTFLQTIKSIYNINPIIYSYPYFIQSKLQNTELSQFPLWYANWTFDKNKLPNAPFPWSTYIAWQYSDKETIPGIPGIVDANIFLGGKEMPVPNGWSDNGSTLTSPPSPYDGKQYSAVLGFRDAILNNNWNKDDVLLCNEYYPQYVLLHNKGIGSGSRILTRDHLLWYTQEKGVIIEPYPGWELQAAYDEIDRLNAKIQAFSTDSTDWQQIKDIASKH